MAMGPPLNEALVPHPRHSPLHAFVDAVRRGAGCLPQSVQFEDHRREQVVQPEAGERSATPGSLDQIADTGKQPEDEEGNLPGVGSRRAWR